jgi:hypothetical protein
MSPVAIEAIGRALSTSAGAEEQTGVKRRARPPQ